MTKINESDLSSIILENTKIRDVEPHIFSVLPSDESGNEYDTEFGFLYDLVACNSIYNRLIWGYSVKILANLVYDALQSTREGIVLDLGCGSLSFTAKAYCQSPERPVILVDQSLKMLRMAKSRLIKQNGKVPNNLLFLHSDALQLPFQRNVFTTIISENLLHCLDDTMPLLKKVKSILSTNCKVYFTTLVKNNRLADKYLQAMADSGKLIPRTVTDHQKIFEQADLSAKYETTGNMLVIEGES